MKEQKNGCFLDVEMYGFVAGAVCQKHQDLSVQCDSGVWCLVDSLGICKTFFSNSLMFFLNAVTSEV